MTSVEHKYFEHPDFVIRHLEWTAFQCIHFDKNWIQTSDAFPKYEQRAFRWVDPFNAKAKEKHRLIKGKLYKKEITTMDEFYCELDKLLKPKPLGKALKDKKQRTAQSAYQKEQLGDAFIDNNKLLSKAKQSAFQLAEHNADKDMIVARANELVSEYSNEALSPEQLDTLITYIEKQINKHLKLDRVEASIIDTDNKTMYFMWGKIKRQIVKKDTFAWTNAVAAKQAHCSKGDVKTIMKKLEKLGAITCIQKGKSGSFTRRANLYRREV
ncbi:hypothetical protein OAD02_04645 [Alphaproteobacteria bacterium]|nr:hypothetical protein [Alphaproteobacteria bacterium]